jgi:glycosyltransferase involved in cell wall biosynthesis
VIEPLRIAINAQLRPFSTSGGIEQALIGLVAALGELDDGPEEYVLIGPWQEPDWLEPYLGPNQRIVPSQGPAGPARRLGPLVPAVRPLWPFLRRARSTWSRLVQGERRGIDVPKSDGFYERLECQVVHFPYQSFVVCDLPTVYNPHDLQHVHYPQFFTASAIAWRETTYRAGCQLAHTVVVGSNWVKEDIIRHYRVSPDKVQVIPWAPLSEPYPEPSPATVQAVKDEYALQLPFALYPAVTWEHKNHLRLLEALALLRDRDGLVVRLVCTGAQHPSFWAHIQERLRTLHLDGQVRFLGMVPPEHFRSIYKLAQFVVVPTLFEAASSPVFEAWLEAVPVACSTVTSLPEQAGDAALLFDPFHIEAIADAVRRMAGDEHLRADLIRKGKRRLQDFNWERTAKTYRAVYRRAAGGPLTEEDRWLLSWDWMQNPENAEKRDR